MTIAPIILEPNRPARPYLGGDGIAALRGTDSDDAHRPEDFVASTVSVFGDDLVGLSMLPDGRVLKDAIEDAPESFLGVTHLAEFGAQPELLVKLLDTGERLFVHFHPDDDFATAHLGLSHGKTEAWVVTSLRDVGPDSGVAYLGFRREVALEEVADWVDRQDIAAMLGALNRITLRVGDAILVPAGVPHAIGPGVTVVELQEPSDLSVLLEFTGFPGVDRDGAFLELDERTALGALDRSAWIATRLSDLVVHRRDGQILPTAAEQFFRAERIVVDGHYGMESSYAVLVVVDGEGELHAAESVITLSRGATVLVPHGAGRVVLTGRLEVLRCRPPITRRTGNRTSS